MTYKVKRFSLTALRKNDPDSKANLRLLAPRTTKYTKFYC